MSKAYQNNVWCVAPIKARQNVFVCFSRSLLWISHQVERRRCQNVLNFTYHWAGASFIYRNDKCVALRILTCEKCVELFVRNPDGVRISLLGILQTWNAIQEQYPVSTPTSIDKEIKDTKVRVRIGIVRMAYQRRQIVDTRLSSSAIAKGNGRRFPSSNHRKRKLIEDGIK